MAKVSGERGRNRRTRKKGRPGKRARRVESPRRPRRPSGRRHTILTKALALPVRRRMLRVVTKENAPLNPAQLAKAFDLPLGLVSYHAAVLQTCGAVQLAAEEDG